jgi:guanosine-3',5'-bis(diphosphate) 3'-pyrophosphohydrolase
MSVALEAMIFARRVHADQVRKYTGNPYSDHLAEVAGIVSTVLQNESVIAIAWLHDCMEDQHVSHFDLNEKFGLTIADGVAFLSDMEEGNRAERKALSRARLAEAPPWVQTIKVADLISNTSSIVKHDPKFALTYLEEKRLLLDVLTHANQHLLRIAREQVA